jgi:hypothetical protein
LHAKRLGLPSEAHQASDGGQAGVVAANLQHERAALERVGHRRELSGHLSQHSLSGALRGLSLADGQGLVGGRQQDGGVVAHHLLGVHEAVLAQQRHGGVDEEVVGQVGDGGQAGVVAANLQHQGAALEGVSDGRELGGHLGQGGLGGALGSLGGADGQGLLSGGHQHRCVVADQLLGVHEAVLAQQRHGGVDQQVVRLGEGRVREGQRQGSGASSEALGTEQPTGTGTRPKQSAVSPQAKAHQLGDGGQAGVVAANLQHQRAALERVGHRRELSGHLSQHSLSGALRGLSLADGQGLVGGRQQDGGVVAHHLLGVHEAVLAQQRHGGVDEEVVGQVGDGGQAGVVAANLQHQGAALEGVSDSRELGGHLGQGGLGGGSRGLGLEAGLGAGARAGEGLAWHAWARAGWEEAMQPGRGGAPRHAGPLTQEHPQNRPRALTLAFSAAASSTDASERTSSLASSRPCSRTSSTVAAITRSSDRLAAAARPGCSPPTSSMRGLRLSASATDASSPGTEASAASASAAALAAASASRLAWGWWRGGKVGQG